MERIVLNKIIKRNNLVEYSFSIPEKIKHLFAGEKNFFIELPPEFDASAISDSILAIPFVGVMLTATMLTDVGITVDVLDDTFSKSIRDIDKAFNYVYPKGNLFFDVCTKRTEKNEKKSSDCSVFFTGGVDATCALITKLDKSPTMINIIGADTDLSAHQTHDNIKKYMEYVQDKLNIPYKFIKSNLRSLFNETELHNLCTRKRGLKHGGWWATIAYILSMTSTIAPLLWSLGIKTHYIGSSYTSTSKEYDSNHLIIIDAIKYADTHFESANYDIERLEKTKLIVDFCNEKNLKLNLHVCWLAVNGVNCSNCEKCYRTILGLVLANADPNQYGFSVNSETYVKIKETLQNEYVNPGFWKIIQRAFKSDKEKWKNDSRVSWISNCRINSLKVYYKLIKRKLLK